MSRLECDAFQGRMKRHTTLARGKQKPPDGGWGVPPEGPAARFGFSCGLDKGGGQASCGMPSRWCPHGDSNPGLGLERAASWSSRRWGQAPAKGNSNMRCHRLPSDMSRVCDRAASLTKGIDRRSLVCCSASRERTSQEPGNPHVVRVRYRISLSKRSRSGRGSPARRRQLAGSSSSSADGASETIPASSKVSG